MGHAAGVGAGHGSGGNDEQRRPPPRPAIIPAPIRSTSICSSTRVGKTMVAGNGVKALEATGVGLRSGATYTPSTSALLPTAGPPRPFTFAPVPPPTTVVAGTAGITAARQTVVPSAIHSAASLISSSPRWASAAAAIAGEIRCVAPGAVIRLPPLSAGSSSSASSEDTKSKARKCVGPRGASSCRPRVVRTNGEQAMRLPPCDVRGY